VFSPLAGGAPSVRRRRRALLLLLLLLGGGAAAGAQPAAGTQELLAGRPRHGPDGAVHAVRVARGHRVHPPALRKPHIG